MRTLVIATSEQRGQKFFNMFTVDYGTQRQVQEDIQDFLHSITGKKVMQKDLPPIMPPNEEQIRKVEQMSAQEQQDYALDILRKLKKP